MATKPRPPKAEIVKSTETPEETPGSLHVWALPAMPNGTRDSRFDEDGHAELPYHEGRDLVDAELATTEQPAPADEE